MEVDTQATTVTAPNTEKLLSRLSAGFIKDFLGGKKPKDPCVQVLLTRPLKIADKVDDRFRMKISDGTHFYSVVLSDVRIFDKIKHDKLEEAAVKPVIVLTDYDSSYMSDRFALVIKEYRIVCKLQVSLGNPQELAAQTRKTEDAGGEASSGVKLEPAVKHEEDANHERHQKPAMAPSAAQNVRQQQPPQQQNVSTAGFYGQQPTAPRNQQRAPAARPPAGAPQSNNQNITPIQAITPYIHKWRICGTVTDKENLRKINTARGESQVFSFVLTDTDGRDIKVTAWGEQAERYFTLVEEGSTYYLTNGSVRPVNKRFNTTSHDYEISMKQDSELTVCHDRAKAQPPKIRFNFRAFSDLGSLNNEMVDLLGVVHQVGEKSTVVSKKSGETLIKRDVQVMDAQGTVVTMTLWGEQAENFTVPDTGNPSVIALKAASVREFNGGYSISVGFKTKYELNPDIPDAFTLLGSYESRDPTAQVNYISSSMTPGGGGGGMRDVRLIGVADAIRLGAEKEKGDYFNIVAYVSHIRTENAYYKGCTNGTCKKKVSELDSSFRCEKCNVTLDKYRFIMMLSVEVADFSGTHWVTLFDETGAKLLGVDAEKLGSTRETGTDEEYEGIFDGVRFKQFLFRIHSKMETFNDEQRIKWRVLDVKPLPEAEYETTLKAAIAKMEAI